jgi:two-component system, chemotaxis family, CheB/CheR fusion protein
MALEQSPQDMNPSSNTMFEGQDLHAAGGYAGEPISVRLREALAQIEALLRERDELIHELAAWRENAANHIAGLSPRQRQVMDLVLAGHPSKIIAENLGISQRTVENHRASIMKRTRTNCIAALARLALAAAWSGGPELPR